MIASVFNADNPNVPMLELVVHALGDLCESLVFVGGCATGLLVTSFHNRWYPLAVATAQLVRLPSGHVISLIAPPVFIATKLEAFHDRGEGDFLGSHDLEDIVTVVDGRPELLEEVRASPTDLREYLASDFRDLIGTPAFLDALPGHLPGDTASQARLPELLRRLRVLAT